MISPNSNSQFGYTLPVFACAAAIAAAQRLCDRHREISQVTVELIQPPQCAEIPIEQVALLSERSALAVTRSDPGQNLDLTRDTPVWAMVEWGTADQADPIELIGGEGIGHRADADQQPAIYRYARTLLVENLQRHILPDQRLRVTLILPEGRSLAERTSNAAFGIVEGLSLLGTSGISQPLSAPEQLQDYRADIAEKAQHHASLVFCIGENGLSLASRLGIAPQQLVKTANWLGPLLVEAGVRGVQSILLFGYHGKLIKLAGGIFHTHHYLADGRQEILAAHAAVQGLPLADVQKMMASPTVEAALQHLRQFDQTTGSTWVQQIYEAIAQQIDQRAERYIFDHTAKSVQVGSVLFDRNREIIIKSLSGGILLSQDLLS